MVPNIRVKRYKTRDICKIFDISKATLFRWEKDGLISNVGRDWRNWRLYSKHNIKEIRKIMQSRNSRL
ncbi:MAG: MerR family transcriptional regulator [Nitrospirae bacterium]|nr:MerR family transcriptional regulator [Nitrospirota bacterium]